MSGKSHHFIVFLAAVLCVVDQCSAIFGHGKVSETTTPPWIKEPAVKRTPQITRPGGADFDEPGPFTAKHHRDCFDDFGVLIDLPNADEPHFLNCSTPQFGIDWFGYNNTNKRWVPGEPNPFFDPKKPTIIHAPGWEKGRCAVFQKTTFNFRLNSMDKDMPVDENAADYWIDRGWNIGIWQWNAFNEESLSRSEANIYEGDLHWRNHRGEYIPGGSDVSVSELYYRAFISLFDGVRRDPKVEIRLTGNSLGGQLTVQVTKLLLDRLKETPQQHLIPDRIALLDPWFTAGSTYDANLKAIHEIAEAGVLIEYYQSTNLCYYFYGISNLFCKATEIKAISALSRTSPDWVSPYSWDKDRFMRLNAVQKRIRFDYMIQNALSALPVTMKHIAAFTDYFRSVAFPPPPVACLRSKLATTAQCELLEPEYGLSAASSNEMVQREMGRSKFYVQIAGQSTPTLEDDVYARIGSIKTDDHVMIPRFPRHFNLIRQLRTRFDPRCRPEKNGTRLYFEDRYCDGWSTN